jgi:uncharacterized damage-inducible protein DinB
MDSILLLRHALATLAYRTLRAVSRAPAEFSSFRAGPGSRSAGEILAHMGDLLDWAHRFVEGNPAWTEVPAAEWEADKDRFYAALTRFDQAVQNGGEAMTEKLTPRLLQGPIADALTHVGQLAMLRGLAGAPVPPENYFVADIAAGRTTQIQPSPKRTF